MSPAERIAHRHTLLRLVAGYQSHVHRIVDQPDRHHAQTLCVAAFRAVLALSASNPNDQDAGILSKSCQTK